MICGPRRIDITEYYKFSDDTVTVYNVPPDEIIYITIELEYDLIGKRYTKSEVETWYSEHNFNATVHPITSEVTVTDPEIQIPPMLRHPHSLLKCAPLIRKKHK